jgi:hypothetical protein
MPLDNAGNVLTRARNISLSTNVQTFRDTIGGFDTDDFYRFNAKSRVNLDLNLDGLIGNANLQLLDRQGTVLNSSASDPNSRKNIAQVLNAGIYYIRIYSPDPAIQTAYRLQVAAPLDAGDTLKKAQKVQFKTYQGTDSFSIDERLEPGAFDSSDYYRFVVAKDSTFKLDLNSRNYSSVSHVAAELLNSKGRVLEQTNFNQSYQNLTRTLKAGTYYVRAFSINGVSESYHLSFSTTPDAGGTLAKARSITPSPWPVYPNDYIDPIASDVNDYYRFTLNSLSTISLSTNTFGATAPLGVELLDRRGKLIANNSVPDSLYPDRIYRTLGTGTYYVRFFSPSAARIAYGFTLNAIPEAGDTLATARKLPSGETSEPTNREFIDGFIGTDAGKTDTSDYYRFTVKGSKTFNLAYSVDRGTSTIELLDGKGNLVKQSSLTVGSFPQTVYLSQTINPGTYYIHVAANTSTFYSFNYNNLVDPGNTRSTAQPITLSTWDQVIERIDPIDPEDYYRFTLNESNRIQLFLSDLSDNNGNDGTFALNLQLLNSQGDVVASSNNLGLESESIDRMLNAGTYYIRVLPEAGTTSTNYSLSMQAIPDAGDTLATARVVGSDFFTSDAINQDFPDSFDYYRFNVNSLSTFNLSLTGLAADLNVELLNNRGEVVSSSTNTGTTNEAIDRLLDAGTYYVKVLQGTPGASSNYWLFLNTTPDAGDTANTARKITLPIFGHDMHPTGWGDRIDNTDPVDFYQFTLSWDRNVDLILSPASANVDLQLYTRNGLLVASSTNSGTSGERIKTLLDVGTYYLRGYQPVAGEATNYSLFGFTVDDYSRI